MKNKLVMLAISLSAISMATVKKDTFTGNQAAKNIRSALLGYSSLTGEGGCKISIVNLGGFFGGIEVVVTDRDGKKGTVSIESFNTVYRTIENLSSHGTTTYRIGFDTPVQPAIDIDFYEDVSDFNLTLRPNGASGPVYSCFVPE